MKSSTSFLHHILDETQFLGKNLGAISFEQFLGDPVLRSLEVIGEAVKKIPADIQKKYPDVEWRKMAATRNRLIHGYFSVDYELVWDIVENKIPVLQKQIDHILRQEQRPLNY